MSAESAYCHRVARDGRAPGRARGPGMSPDAGFAVAASPPYHPAVTLPPSLRRPGAGAGLSALLSACAAPDPADTGPRTEEIPPADTSAVPPEIVSDAPEPVLPAEPGAATLTCAEALPAEGKVDCMLSVVGPDGRIWWDGPAGAGLHGRSSLGFPKPQIAIELRARSGLQEDADLFGMGEEADWLLNGMWIDRALMRNKLAYDLHRELTDGRDWAPESVYVELTWNGSYYGVYALVERIDRADGRLDIPPDDGTGASFIVKGAEAGIPSTVQYAHWERTYPTVTTAEVDAGVTAKLAEMEALIVARDPALWDVVDLDSAVAFVLTEEVFKNNDAFYLSHHVYVGADGKLRFAPWDLDLSLGQPSYNDNENPGSWIVYRPELVAGMGETPGFTERMATMWAEWRATELADGAVDARIDGIVAGLGDAVDRNFERWPIEQVDFGGTLYAVASHEEEIARVKAFAAARVAWMDANVQVWGSGAGAR